MLTNASTKNADSAATTRSQASARDSPMPAAAPCTPATTGLGISRIPVMIGWYCRVSLPYTSGGPSSVRSARFSRRSAPLENALPAR